MGTEEIIQRVLGGDTEAYAEIVRKYQTDIWRTVSYAMQDLATTEDLVQQAFVNAYLNLSQYQTGRDFRAWLRAIARNLVAKELRRKTRLDRRYRKYHQWLKEELSKQDESFDALSDDLHRELRRCRKNLSDSANQALSLRYEQNLGFGEMAKMLGRSVVATRQMLFRIRKALRRCLEERSAQA